jgi:hypothetical protein
MTPTTPPALLPLPEPQKECWIGHELFSPQQMRAYAMAHIAAERERCAAMADEYATWGGSNFHKWFTKLAAAIREG